MANLNFQTATIINSNVDVDSQGKALFEKTTVDGDDCLRIKRDFVFLKKNVDVVRRRVGYEAKKCKATIDFTKLLATLKPTSGTNYCRLDIYVRVEGAEPFIYSTPWYHKGRPFWVEFDVKATDTAITLAKRVEKTIKSNHIFQIDKDILNLSNDGAGKLTLEGAEEFLRFHKMSIALFTLSADDAEVVAELNADTVVADDAIALVEKGLNSFGTYSEITKDLRLPTAENTHWVRTRQAETPIVGAVYDQYIIEYHAPANSACLSVVGSKGTSYTTHVFWVKHDTELTKAWETALGALGDIIDSDTGNKVSTESLTTQTASVNTKSSK